MAKGVKAKRRETTAWCTSALWEFARRETEEQCGNHSLSFQKWTGTSRPQWPVDRSPSHKTHKQTELNSPRRVKTALWLLDLKDGVVTILGMLVTVIIRHGSILLETLVFNCPVRPYLWNSSRSAERVWVEFDVEEMNYTLSTRFRFSLNLYIITDTNWRVTRDSAHFFELYSGGSH